VHDEFRGMGLSGVGRFLGAGAVVVDVRGMFDDNEITEKEFERQIFKSQRPIYFQ
jgi:hypothetical protein